jgi:long-chain acyl-CoA synthetase
VFARQQAMAQPDKPAIIMASSGETVTFGEYEARSNRVARFLRDAGLQRGDHIAVFIENSPQLLEIEGGAERTGLYYTLINTYLGAEEVAYVAA